MDGRDKVKILKTEGMSSRRKTVGGGIIGMNSLLLNTFGGENGQMIGNILETQEENLHLQNKEN
jgi:hypothetical protein